MFECGYDALSLSCSRIKSSCAVLVEYPIKWGIVAVLGLLASNSHPMARLPIKKKESLRLDLLMG